jgi:hypothetical protein
MACYLLPARFDGVYLLDYLSKKCRLKSKVLRDGTWSEEVASQRTRRLEGSGNGRRALS